MLEIWRSAPRATIFHRYSNIARMSETNTSQVVTNPTSYGITPPTQVAGTEFVSADGKNTKTLICKICGCKILDPNGGSLVATTLNLHSTKSGGIQEELVEFWKVNDKFDYLNMGFSHAVNPEGSRSYKYLTCADCEIPVLGLQYLDEEPSFVSTQRVNYQ
eukprot:Phypoly_transcript_21531.p1 GENE.Phypoly_transcript_21531~~Phypoly_transcript_21531.p1  ORF type:complete len:161 (+),score=21.49 Phypoly_transcript_21531:12-494(+)